jgi:hypothetical protein
VREREIERGQGGRERERERESKSERASERASERERERERSADVMELIGSVDECRKALSY